MNENQKTISLDDLPAIKKRYNRAVRESKDSFTYKDGVLLTGYAKYLIEYLECIKSSKNEN